MFPRTIQIPRHEFDYTIRFSPLTAARLAHERIISLFYAVAESLHMLLGVVAYPRVIGRFRINHFAPPVLRGGGFIPFTKFSSFVRHAGQTS